jgi:hypothetical protein
MDHAITRRSLAAIAVLTVFIFSSMLQGQTINVTMKLNTATNLDTLSTKHVVQIRGESKKATTPAVAWDDKTGITLVNKGGDYWETTFAMNVGDTLKFKFWTGFTATAGTFFWGGWEGPLTPGNAGINSGDNRLFIAGSKDTTLAIQFYNGTADKRNQYWKPYAAKPDTFAVYLRVNMAALMETGDFDPKAGGTVVVRGGKPLDPTDSWNTLIPLQQEAGSVNTGSFFSGTGYVAKSAVAGGETQSFKFVYYKGGSAIWESTSDRKFKYSTAKDTTIHWAYFNNTKPTGGNIVTANLTWQVKTDGLEKLKLFNRSLGDRVVIDGATKWASDMAEAIQMNYVPLLQLWMGQESFKKAPGAVMEYKTVLIWDASRVDPASPNYLPGLELTVPLNYWEEPSVTGTGNRNYTYTDKKEQAIPGDYGFAYQYFNGLPAQGVIETPLTITFNVNMSPATSAATNPSNPLFRPGVDTVWVRFYGCLMSLTQGDGLYTNTAFRLEDKDGDLVYTGSKVLKMPAPYDVGYRIEYSSASGTIQNGGGFQKGRSYYQYVHPTEVKSGGTITWPAAFSFPVVPWKDSDLTVEDPPNLFTPTGVQDEAGAVAAVAFDLRPNYPNPFNPSTTIQYQVENPSRVAIGVYNISGQLLRTLVDENQEAGPHSITWNGTNSQGQAMPSGVYFVKMKAQSFMHVQKITMIR